jgi:hypothetical protein
MTARSLITASVLTVTILAVPHGLAAQEMAQDNDLTMKLASIEKSLWEGWKNADGASFQKHLVDDAVDVGPWGIHVGKSTVIADITDGGCDVKGYSFADWQAHKVGESTAILTYSATQDAVCDGETIPTDIVVSSTYVMSGGTWKTASHQETPVAKP